MAILAFFAITTLMYIVKFMARITGLFAFFLGIEPRACVAGVALDFFMRPSETVFGVTIVFELYLFPITFAVTGLAFSSVFSLVSVVDFVTTDACFWGVFIMFICVAEVAFDLFMVPFERKFGFAVVKDLLLTPRFCTVAVCAFFAQLALVAVIGLVAVDAVMRCFTMRLARGVAGIAGGF